MATLAEIHAGLVTRLDTIDGLRVRDHVPDQIEPPMAVVTFVSSTFHGAFQDGLRPYEFVIVVLVGQANSRSAQASLLEYANTTGTKSIKAAIEADRTLGLTNTDAIVTEVDTFQTEQVGGYQYVGLTFTLAINSR